MAKLIIIGGVAIGAAAIIAGITVPIVVSNQGNGSTETPSTPNLPTDAQKINELKEKFTKGLDEANKKITDSAKFVETYESLKKELGKSNTSNGITYVLSEVKVTDETNISANKEIAIKYDFTLATTKDSLTYSFKNPKVVDPNPEPEKPGQDKTDWQKVRIVKEQVLNKIEESYKTQSFENLYNLYLSELNQIKTGEFNVTIKLFEFKAEFPKAERVVNNSYFDIKYEIAYNGYSEVLEFKFKNSNPIQNIKMVDSLTSNKDGYTVENGIIVKDFRIKDENSKFDEVIIPEYIETNADLETGIIFRAKVTGIGDNLYKNRQVRSIKLHSSLKSIGRYAFAYNDILNIGFGQVNSLETIGEGAFKNNRIKSLILPASVTSIGEAAFYSNNITKLDLSHTKVTKIEGDTFHNNQIESLNLGLMTTEIGESAFYGNNLSIDAINNSNLRDSRVTKIGLFAFGHQKTDLAFNLQNGGSHIQNPNGLIKLPKTISLIGRGAFEVKSEIQFWGDRFLNPMSSPMFTVDNDSWTYSKRINILNEDGTQSSYSSWYDFSSRAFFNASLINWNYAKNISEFPKTTKNTL